MGELDEIFRVLGEEPMDKTVQSLCNGLKQHHCHCIRLYYLKFLACPARFERATYALEGRCSIQLSYGQMDFLDFNGMLEPWEFGIGL